MADSCDIVVLGARGNTGRPLISLLERRGLKVRAVMRRAEGAASFGGDTQIALGDLADPASLTEAMRGAGAIHLIPPVFDDREEAFGANVIAAAQAAGVRRISYHSVLHAPTPAMPHHRRKSMVELQLRESPLEWTIVQPAMYMQTPFAFYDAAAGMLRPTFRTDRPFNPIDIEDLTEAVANILTQDGHEYATYELAGAERLDCADMAQAIGTALGRPIGIEQQAAEPFARGRGHARDFDARQIDELLAMYRHYDGHGLVGNGNVLRMILGRAPHGFVEVARRDLG